MIVAVVVYRRLAIRWARVDDRNTSFNAVGVVVVGVIRLITIIINKNVIKVNVINNNLID